MDRPALSKVQSRHNPSAPSRSDIQHTRSPSVPTPIPAHSSTLPTLSTTALPISTDHWWESESPWTYSSQSNHPIPDEHQDAYQATKQRVEKVKSIFGIALHEALAVGLLKFVPILHPLAETLLRIWDSVQLVDTNRSACLRLTKRCAETLLSIHQEIENAGNRVGDELKVPMQQLSEAFKTVHAFLKREAARPFLKRYLRRDNSTREIASCDNLLHEAQSRFSLSIHVRLLRQVQDNEKDRQRDVQIMLDAIQSSRVTTQVDNNAHGLSGIHEGGYPGSLTPRLQGLPPSSSHASLQSGSVIPLASSSTPFAKSHKLDQARSSVFVALNDIRNKENEHDAALDMADLRSISHAALSSGSDAEMLETLGISRDDIPEAITILKGALVERQGSAIPQHVPNPIVKEEPLVYKGQESVGTGQHKIARRSSCNGLGKVVRSGMISSVSASFNSESRQTLSKASESDLDDLEFIETGINALEKMSRNTELNVPSWTITRFQVDIGERIGFGGFSDVYKGTWRERTVAVKILSPKTPINLFVREVTIWEKLKHPNVLELNGASRVHPLFFVSPYEKHGNLTEYLRQIGTGIQTSSLPSPMNAISSSSRTNQDILSIPHAHNQVRSGSESSEAVEYDTKGLDLLKIMYQIAEGMQYLHKNDVLHGNLKAANILVNNELNCVISDFGQSELRSEVYRRSGTSPKKGTTLRWQAPEVMKGLSTLTPQVDVYAFAMTCVEILSMGEVPWSSIDDETVQHFVLKKDSRPLIPITPFTKRGEPQILQQVLCLCWHQHATMRPDFDRIVASLKKIRRNEGVPKHVSSAKLPALPLKGEDTTASPEPVMAERRPHQEDETPPVSSESKSFHPGGSTMASIPPKMTTGPSTVRVSMPEPKTYLSRPSNDPLSTPAPTPTPNTESFWHKCCPCFKS